MRTQIRLLMALVLIALTSFSALAQTKFSLEIDPATFAFGGYSLHLRLQPGNSEHLLLGAGTYAMNLPDPMVNLNPENKYEGWDVRISKGYGFFGEYHLAEVNKGLFIGTQLGIQKFRVEKDDALGDAEFTNSLLMGYLGYSIKPFNNALYIKPWAGIGYTAKLSGTTSLSSDQYDISPITMFATLHVGYTFK